MGIKNLKPFLKKQCPDAFTEIHLSSYSYKKIAIDTSLFIMKYKSVCGDQWVSAILGLIYCLRKNNIDMVWVFDGKNPIEKDNEKQKRKDQRDLRDQKIYDLEQDLVRFSQTNEVSDLLISISEKNKNLKLKRLLGKPIPVVDIYFCQKELEKMKSQCFGIYPEDILKIKELLDILKIAHLQSDTEGETLCAYLYINNKVDAVLSEDTDVLAYGVNNFLTKINTFSMKCEEISLDKILGNLNLDKFQFTDLCILCGCDYNTNIPKVGANGAYKLLKTYQNIDKITGIDISMLNHKRVRKLFSVPIIDIQIPHLGLDIDFNLLQRFTFENSISFDISKMKEVFQPTQIVFE